MFLFSGRVFAAGGHEKQVLGIQCPFCAPGKCSIGRLALQFVSRENSYAKMRVLSPPLDPVLGSPVWEEGLPAEDLLLPCFFSSV